MLRTDTASRLERSYCSLGCRDHRTLHILRCHRSTCSPPDIRRTGNPGMPNRCGTIARFFLAFCISKSNLTIRKDLPPVNNKIAPLGFIGRLLLYPSKRLDLDLSISSVHTTLYWVRSPDSGINHATAMWSHDGFWTLQTLAAGSWARFCFTPRFNNIFAQCDTLFTGSKSIQ